MFGAGGFNAVAADDVRAEVWDALLPPLAFGALGITSGLSAPEIVGRTDLHPTLEALVRELAELAAALGHPMTVGLDELWTLAQQPGRIRPDLTADLDARRRAELEAVLDAPLELAARANVPMPTLNTLRALIRTRTQR
nr:ketopantoate reductase C-terminal domain-containing protein [Azospirillum rugosum]